MKIRLMLLLLALVACSCSKKVQINIPDEGNKPVMNVLMTNDSLIAVQILMSKYIDAKPGNVSSGGWQTLDNAKVMLYENDVYMGNMVVLKRGDFAYYLLSVKATSGSRYRVTAEIPGFPMIEGEDFIPRTASLGEMSVKKISGNQRESKANVSFELHDKGGERNYYRIRIYEHLNWNDGGSDKALLQLPIQSSDPSDVIFGKKERQEIFIDDQLFDGRSPRFSFIATSWQGFKKPVEIEVTTLTYNSYNYLYSSMMAEEKNDNILSEKVIVFNNILHGLGIVGGMSIDRHTVEY
ncbi:DUF4249 domain-containing protein [Chitinophaga sp. G-6-1-13]|uniref:DUF4249 domain-containing protein n=1 Tax=Chitinophaga fulva TaxID=2728842 RepID=A0A848GQM6_9BACT|nr:DUF4249 domain-containing protein [Chitinophaga fulva]NML40277.1 DUF4249 domain-containing protein [Chitinophaga fulva]